MEVSMEYAGDLARIQQAATRTHAARRVATLQATDPKVSEAILEIGCGNGLFVHSLAEAVGSTGRACGIDLSDDQVSAARVTCAGLSNVELAIGNALTLPFAQDSFDAVTTIHTLEYIEDVPRALAEMHRVLKPGGRLVNFATNWGALFWHSRDPERMLTMLKAWDSHAPYPNLPARIRPLLADAGFSEIHQEPVAVLNCRYDDQAYSYWLARLVAAFVTGRGLVSKDEAAHWLEDLAATNYRNEYFFCSTAVVTRAEKSI
jgi:ubiquinone/menaquinone biosynthesis C-methylase UbiE